MDPRAVYAAIGEKAFHRLTAAFYQGVASDPLLRPMYPDEELESARRRLALFLMQFFGGPPNYSLQRGHPRLRMRHLPFPIDQAARDAWMTHMRAALDGLDLPADVHAAMLDYFEDASTFLINQAEAPRRRTVETPEGLQGRPSS
ncbi:MAG TPA: globin [Chloroflexota bacterium]|jgi:hemoglobin